MTAEQTRVRIWNEICDAKSMYRYYQAISQRYALWERVSLVLLALFGTGSLATIVDWMPNWVQPFFGLSVAGIAVWTMQADYSSKTSVAHYISARCGELAARLQAVYYEVDGHRIDEVEAIRRLEALSKDLRQVTSESGKAKIRTNKKLTRDSFDAANQEMTHAI